MTPYKIKKECYLLRSCLVDTRRMLLFMVEQVFLPIEVWSIQIHSAWEEEKRRPKGREIFLCLNLSYLAIKYEFYFTLLNIFQDPMTLA